MKSFLEKHEWVFVVLSIIVYVVLNSVCLQFFEEGCWVTACVNILILIGVFLLIFLLKRAKYYGLTKPENQKNFLYFLPLVIIVSVNLWGGVSFEGFNLNTLFFVISMASVGVIEELIFRGLLFKMLEQHGLKLAVAVSAITFGLGHVVNLINGAEVPQTLMQICYSTSIGFLFVLIFHKSKSLVPCIISHSFINVYSIFYVSESLTLFYVTSSFLIVFPLAYALLILWIDKKQ